MEVLKLKGDELFIPNCEKLEDGSYECDPILIVGDKTIGKIDPNAPPIKVVPTKSGNYEYLRNKGYPEIILQKLEKHFRQRKL